MEDGHVIKNYAQYNVWANQRIATFVSMQPPYLMQKEVSSSFNSVWKTIEHLYQAESFWILLITQAYDFDNPQPEKKLHPEHNLNEFMTQTKRLNELVQNLGYMELQTEILTPFSVNRFPILDLLHHVFNHATQHRGQLITIFRQLGMVDLPNLDYNEYLIDLASGCG